MSIVSYVLLEGLNHGEFFTKLHLSLLIQGLMVFSLWSDMMLPLTSVEHVPSSATTGTWAAWVGEGSAMGKRTLLQSPCGRCQILLLLVASKLNAILKLLSS